MLMPLSSSLTFFEKYILNTIFYGGGAFVIGQGLFYGYPAISLVLFIFLGVLGDKTGFRLKKVGLEGSNLVISNYRQTIEVPLASIDAVEETFRFRRWTPWVWVIFREPTGFGKKIVFLPFITQSTPTSESHPIVGELKHLADKFRKKEAKTAHALERAD